MKASQGLISGALLLAIRQTELQRGTLLAHHGRHPAALRPTLQRKVRFNPDRRAAKLTARYREHVAVEAQRRYAKPVNQLNLEMLGEFAV